MCTQRCSASEADLLLLCGPAFTAATSSHEKQENVECLLAFFHFNTFFVFRLAVANWCGILPKQQGGGVCVL